jgi:hypothetical protein
MTMQYEPVIKTCRAWMCGNLYPNLMRDEFLSCLMGIYSIDAHQALHALSSAEQAEISDDHVKQLIRY